MTSISPRHTGKILVVDDEPAARQALGELLRGDGHEVRVAPDGYKALGELEDFSPDLILTDLKMPLMDGIELLSTVRERYPHIPCVVMTAFASIENAVSAMRQGATDYLTKPLNFDAVEIVIERALERVELEREVERLRSNQDRGGVEIIGNSESLRQTIQMIERVAPSRATVLITGESGTGKELAARSIHDFSSRKDAPCVVVHCAALPESLLESELFGHEKGAFTGAHRAHIGHLERAHGGTLFLDEIGEISPAVQVKLLRFLQTGEIQRVGGEQTLQLDVRVVAATNRDLAKEVREGRFREDLYYRLNVIGVEMPPLRKRTGDVPVLASFFAQKYATVNEKAIDTLEPEFLRELERYDWPGNVRELENIIERAVVLSFSGKLTSEHLPPNFGSDPLEHQLARGITIPGATIAQLERFAILETYEACGGDTKRTAEMLDISQRKIQYKLREYAEEE